MNLKFGSVAGADGLWRIGTTYDEPFLLEHNLVAVNNLASLARFDVTVYGYGSGSNQHLGLTAAAGHAADFQHLKQLDGLLIQFNFLLGQCLVAPVLRPLDRSARIFAAQPKLPGIKPGVRRRTGV